MSCIMILYGAGLSLSSRVTEGLDPPALLAEDPPLYELARRGSAERLLPPDIVPGNTAFEQLHGCGERNSCRRKTTIV